MKKNKFVWKVMVGIGLLIVFSVCMFFTMTSCNYDFFSFDIRESDQAIEVIIGNAESANKIVKYKLSEDKGIYTIKVRTSTFAFFGGDFPLKLVINEHKDAIKAIEISDGKNSKVIYPSIQ